MKNKLWLCSGIFGILALVFFFNSIIKVDSIAGSFHVANIQSTVFAAACFVSSVTCAVGASVLDNFEQTLQSSNSNINRMINRTSNEVKLSISNGQNNKPEVNSSEKRSVEEKINIVNETKILNTDPDWKSAGEKMVRCPNCGSVMSIDYIKARKKCPDCGCEYNGNNTTNTNEL